MTNRSNRPFLACFVLVLCLWVSGCDIVFPGSPSAEAIPSDSTGGPIGSGTAGSTATASVQATALEQLSLERINRARLLPAAEAQAAGIALDEGIPGQLDAFSRPAVAMNAILRASAMGHSQEMLDLNYFAHVTPEGASPFDRMETAGYVFLTAGENLAWRGTTGILDDVGTVESQHTDLFVDAGIDGRGHRTTMLNPSFREVGISILRGSLERDGRVYTDSLMQTQDFGTSPSGSTFILGVVYDDTNGNSRYDASEGVENFVVQLGTTAKTTNAAGGYSFEVEESGMYPVVFATGQTFTLSIVRGDQNVKIDLVNRRTLVVNLGLGLP